MTDSKGHDRADATVVDIAKHFGVSTRTVWRWLKSADAPPHRRVGNLVRFVITEVDEWGKGRAA